MHTHNTYPHCAPLIQSLNTIPDIPSDTVSTHPLIDDDMGDPTAATATSSHHHHSHHGRKSNKPSTTATASGTGVASAATNSADASGGRAGKREGRSTFSGAFNALGFGSKPSAAATSGSGSGSAGESQTLLPGTPHALILPLLPTHPYPLILPLQPTLLYYIYTCMHAHIKLQVARRPSHPL